MKTRMEHVGKMCTPCRRERQLEQEIRQNSISLVPQRLQGRANPVIDQSPSTPQEVSIPAREPPSKRNTLRKRRRRGGEAINPTNERQVEAGMETTLNTQDATQTHSPTKNSTNEHETAKKPTWLRNWLGKFIDASNDPPPRTPNSTHKFSFRRSQRTDGSQTSPKNRRSNNQRAGSRSLSSIFCFRPTPKPDSPPITASPSIQPTTPTTPPTPPRPTPSPRNSSLNIPRDTTQATTTSAKRKRRSLTVHWRNSIPSTEEHLLEDQQQNETSGNKRSNRRDSAGIWNKALNDGAENEEEWYNADDPDRLLLENWSLHHRALVEDWQGN